MALSDIFTGGSVNSALGQQRDTLGFLAGQTGQMYNTALTGGVGALQSGQTNAINTLTPAYNTATGYISGSVPQALDFLTGNTNQALSYLTGGQASAIPALQAGVNQATRAYAPLSALSSSYASRGNAASDLYADALGLNGPEGTARAQSAFTASPGYQFSLDTGLDAINRAANATGLGASGNTLRAAGEYATNTADQEYQKYLANVFGIGQLYSPLALQGTQGAATGKANAALTGGTGAANIYTGTGTQAAGLLGNTGQYGAGTISTGGTNLANLTTGYGTNVGNVYTGTAGGIAGLYSGLVPSEAQAINALGQTYAGTYPTGAESDLAASTNLWNLIGNVAIGGAKAYAGMPTKTAGASSVVPFA